MFSYIGGFFCSIFCSLPLYPLQKLKISVHTFKWFPPQIPSLIFEGGEWQRSSEYRKLPKREPFQLDLPRCLLLGRIAMRKLDSLLKSRDITLLTKVHLVKVMVFPVVMDGCEIWTIKKIERQRIDAFKLLYCKRLLRVPWTVRRLNQSILKEMNPEYSLEGLMLKVKLQYFGQLWWEELILWKRPWCWERMRAEGEGCNRGWDEWIANSMDVILSKLRVIAKHRESWYAIVHGIAKSWTWLSN